MAVENDYNLLVANLGFLVENVTNIQSRVQQHLLTEKEEGLDPNKKHWVNIIVQQMPLIESSAFHLKEGAWKVIASRPGEPVFSAQPPEAPDAPP